jgi:outer membrane protein OmpA-like peptidoglycan-associated protein
MRTHPRVAISLALLSAILLSGITSCSSKTATGSAVGAAGGAVIGGVIGNQTGSTARGAIIGAAVGGVAGAIIGHEMDQQAKEIEQNVPGAIVERVGEGIQVTFPSGVLFDFDSDLIRGDAAANLRSLARSLDRYEESNVLIVGHTDAVGADTYNQDLSYRRATSAARFLESQGIEQDVATLGRGEREPVAANDSESGRARNRRIEIAIYANDELRERARREASGR